MAAGELREEDRSVLRGFGQRLSELGYTQAGKD